MLPIILGLIGGGFLVSAFSEDKKYAKGGKLSNSEFVEKTIVYDNEGETFDRYTVFTPDGSVYGMSENASGFNQYLGEKNEIPKGSHLGKKLNNVPKEIEWAVIDRMETYAKGGKVPFEKEIDEQYLVYSTSDESGYAIDKATGKMIYDIDKNGDKKKYWNSPEEVYEYLSSLISKGKKPNVEKDNFKYTKANSDAGTLNIVFKDKENYEIGKDWFIHKSLYRFDDSSDKDKTLYFKFDSLEDLDRIESELKYELEKNTRKQGTYFTNFSFEIKSKMADGGMMAYPKYLPVGVSQRELNKKIKDWYIKNYPTDDLGQEINDRITFKLFWALSRQGNYSPYESLGVADSVIRERVEEKLSAIFTNQKMADGGMMAKGGKLEEGVYRVGKPTKVSPNLYEQKIVEIFENGDIATASDYGRNLSDFISQKYPIISKERLEEQYKLSDGGMMAKGGKVELIVHGKSREYSLGTFESIAAAKRYVSESDLTQPYTIKKMPDTKMMADGGMMAKGGSVDSEIEELWKGYAEAVLFTEEEELGSDYTIYDFDKKTETSTKKMLADYYKKNKKAIEESELSLDVIGNDIWYARSGQGAGFFDHSLDDEIEKQLTDGANAMGEFPSVEAYKGKVSISGGKVFAKDKMADGGKMAKGGMTDYKEAIEKFNDTLLKNEGVLKLSKHYDKTTQEIVKNIQPRISVLRYKDKSIKEVKIDFKDTNSGIVIKEKTNYADGGMMAKGGKINKTKKETMTKKATVAKKNPQTNKFKQVMAHAKSTRKQGEAWTAAVSRAWKEMGK